MKNAWIEMALRKARARSKDKDEQVALTLGFLAAQVKVVRQTMMDYAMQVYHDDLWKGHKLYGKDWRKWVGHALGKSLTPSEQSYIVNGIPVLSYLRRNPITHKDKTIDDATFLDGRLSLFEEALPVIGKLELGSSTGQMLFKRIIIAAATMPRDKFRAYLDENFGRRGRVANVTGRVAYQGKRAIITLTCPKEDAPRLLKKLHGIANIA
jgi:hypothetical protein